MERLIINVPDKNSSFVRVILDSQVFNLKFEWNDFGQYWTFGIFTALREPIVQATKIVPNFPLNMQVVDERQPPGLFGAYTQKDRLLRDDFNNGSAMFAYIPLGET